MRVIFDANVLIADRWLAGADFRTFASSRRETGHELLVPQLAIDEAVNDYAEQLARIEGEIAKATEKLTTLLPGEPPVPLKLDRELRVREYRRALLDRLRDAGASFVAYPRIAHDRVVRRALERRRPFDDKGHNGYRDALMWHSVVSQIRSDGDLGFVTSDQIFYDPTANGSRRREPLPVPPSAEAAPSVAAASRALHQHLIHDLPRPGAAPRLFLTLREFVELEVKPRLPEVVTGRDALERGSLGDFDMKAAVRKHLLRGFAYVMLDPFVLGLPPEVEHASVVAIEDVAHVDVQQVKKFASEWIVDLEVDCELRVETYAWQEVPPEERVALGSPSEEEQIDDVHPRVLLRIRASFTVKPSDWSVTSVAIREVEPVR